MKHIASESIKYLFYLFAVAVFFLTGQRTLNLMGVLTPDNAVLQWSSLAVYEGGFVIWLCYFLFQPEKSIGQYVVSFLGSAFGLLMVLGASFFDLWLGGQELVKVPAQYGELAIWSAFIAIAVNALLLYIAHLVDPTVTSDIVQGLAHAKIMKKVHDKAATKIDAISDDVADEIAETWKEWARAEALLSGKKGTRTETPPGQGSRTTVQLPVPASPLAVEPSKNGHGPDDNHSDPKA